MAIALLVALGPSISASAATPATVAPSSTTSTTTTPPPPTPAQEAFRASVKQLLNGLSGVIAQVEANPVLGPRFTVEGGDPNSIIAADQQDLASMSSTDLDRLKQALAADPSWPQIPSILQGAVAEFSPPAIRPNIPDFPGTFTSTCSTAGSPSDEFASVYDANQAQSAAMAALLSVPGVVAALGFDVPLPLKPILAGIWAVANGAFLYLSQQLQVGLDCATTAFGNTEISTFPVDPNNASTIVQGSSEISVQRLIGMATGTQQEIMNVQNTVTAVNGQADTLTTAAATVNTTLTGIKSVATMVQTNLQTLKVNVQILENTEVTVLNKANLEIANLSTLQQLQVRMEIEANLSRTPSDVEAVGLFQLPQAFGGYLETVQAIVTDSINKQTAVGHGAPGAAKDLAAANAAFAAGNYKTAYQLYSKAYTDVTAP